MERVMSDEEKIRKAIEISQRRNDYYEIGNIKTNNKTDSKKEYKLFRKMFVQITICLFIYITFYLVSSRNFIFSSEIINKTNSILSYDVNFDEWFEVARNSINGLIDKYKNQNNIDIGANTVVELKEENNDLEINDSEQIKNKEENNNDEEKQDENISKMDQDIKYIKEKYNLIKPVNGKITSRFGEREILINGMTSDHKGIDIASNQGTNIEAAIDGQVEEATKNSQYGNYVKIKTDDVLTVYAHCKNINVSKGDYVKKGDVIATVGATGIATGPHLHFEIRLNNRYIDPLLIIEF